MSYREDLKGYLDGELSADREAEMRLAIARDPVLQREVEEIELISAAFQRVPQPSPRGLEQTLTALHRGRPSVGRKAPWPWFLGLGLAGAGALVLSINLMSGGSEMVQADRAANVKGEFSSTMKEAAGAINGYVAKKEPDASVKLRANSGAPPIIIEKVTEKPKPTGVGAAHERDRRTKTSNANVLEKKAMATGSAASAVGAPVDLSKEPKNPGPVFAAKSAVAFDVDPGVIEVRVVSLEQAAEVLKALVEEHGGSVADVPAGDLKQRSFSLDVPVDKFDVLSKKIRELPTEIQMRNQTQNVAANRQSQSAPFTQNQSQSGGFGGGGLAGGGAGGQGPRNVEANQKPKSEATRDVKKVERKKIRVILIPADQKEEPQTESGD